MRGEATGRLRHEAGPGELPTVGDWVACAPVGDLAAIHAVLPRSSELRRGLAGGTTEAQLVAANVDVVMVVTALDRDFNVRRIERYLTQIAASGAVPLLVLTKADTCDDVARFRDAGRTVAGAGNVVVTSTVTGEGLRELRSMLAERTGALVGSSGVGKSSLTNALLGDAALAVGATGQDGRGRHTTTERGLFVLPPVDGASAVLIDTPGMRELRLFGEASDLTPVFADVTALAAACRFRDCAHQDEPGCRVREGLDEDRYRAYLKLKRELAVLEQRHDVRARADAKRLQKQRSRAARAGTKGKE